ncbi:hypothetical protein HAX54_028579 [Datura stramonium]|uniref:Uncharacterized protein n=1 Tax=Datura stramonium TaxID=4076 RepID=A0ABS8V6Y1_DATST|nr:hypothetical protein [Datura stramonium]
MTDTASLKITSSRTSSESLQVGLALFLNYKGTPEERNVPMLCPKMLVRALAMILKNLYSFMTSFLFGFYDMYVVLELFSKVSLKCKKFNTFIKSSNDCLIPPKAMVKSVWILYLIPIIVMALSTPSSENGVYSHSFPSHIAAAILHIECWLR